MYKVLLLIFSIMILSCSEEVFTKKQLMQLTLENDPQATYVIPKTMEDGIKCEDYGGKDACVSGHTIRLLGLEAVYVEYKSEKLAKKYAKIYNGYYARNWMFDEVQGEPILENFVVKVYGAKKGREAGVGSVETKND